jgi:hypothetical protein
MDKVVRHIIIIIIFFFEPKEKFTPTKKFAPSQCWAKLCWSLGAKFALTGNIASLKNGPLNDLDSMYEVMKIHFTNYVAGDASFIRKEIIDFF